jgi:hypothetical protein
MQVESAFDLGFTAINVSNDRNILTDVSGELCGPVP